MLNSTTCNSILEAMACGLPIITSKVGGNAAYLEGTTNVLVENGNEEDFVRETISLLHNESRLDELGKMSRDRSFELNWSKTAKEIEVFYNSIQE